MDVKRGSTEDFTNKVKLLREQLGMSQDQLAKALGVSFATVNRWENGRTRPSTLAKQQLEYFITQQQQQGKLR